MAALPGGPFLHLAGPLISQEVLFFAPGPPPFWELKMALLHTNIWLVLCPLGFKSKHLQEVKRLCIYLFRTKVNHYTSIFLRSWGNSWSTQRKDQIWKESPWARSSSSRAHLVLMYFQFFQGQRWEFPYTSQKFWHQWIMTKKNIPRILKNHNVIFFFITINSLPSTRANQLETVGYEYLFN